MLQCEDFEVGDNVVAAVLQQALGKGSGVATELRYFHAWVFRDGRVTRMEAIREREHALAVAREET